MPTNDDNIEWKDCWKKPVRVQYREITKTTEIETREGKLYGYAGKDVLIKGVRGEVYPCKIDIFNDTYTTTAPLSEEQIRAAAAKQIFAELADKKLLDISHYSCDDSYYACPKTKDGEDYHGKGDCNCGAERRIKEVEEIKKKYKVNEK